MSSRIKILSCGYALGTPVIAGGLWLLFLAGVAWQTDETHVSVLRNLLLGIALVTVGIWFVVHFVVHAYAGQVLEPKDLPQRCYKLISRNGRHIILEEGSSEWVPFGQRQYCVLYRGEVDYDSLWMRTHNNTLLRVERGVTDRFLP